MTDILSYKGAIMKKSLLVLACLSLLSFNSCNENGDNKNPQQNQQSSDGNSDNQDSNSDKQESNTDKIDTNTTEDSSIVKEGNPCNSFLPKCADSENLLVCSSDGYTDSFHWQKKPCEPDTFCSVKFGWSQLRPEYEYACTPSCDPTEFVNPFCNNYNEDDNYYFIEGTRCVESEGRFLMKNINRHCSKCLDGNNCIIDDSKLGLDAKQGDACHYGLFKNHCTNNNSIMMCAKDSYTSAKVIEIKCEADETCIVDPTINPGDYVPDNKIYCKKKDQNCSTETSYGHNEWHINYTDKTCAEVEIYTYCISGSEYKYFTAYLSSDDKDSKYDYDECFWDVETCNEKDYCHLNSNRFTIDNL